MKKEDLSAKSCIIADPEPTLYAGREYRYRLQGKPSLLAAADQMHECALILYSQK